MRAELLIQTKMITRAIDIEKVKTLSGTGKDLENPDYQRLKEQLTRIISANDKGRFIYLMGQRPDGAVFFLVDNELPDSELNRLVLLITLHDIGKINIPEELLIKQQALTEQEWEVMKKHSETGYRIAMATEEFAHVAEDILSHHEKFDGSGYPRGLKSQDIPLLARITAVADAYEVMSNGRPYKKAMPSEAIIAEFKKCSGTHFDPDLVNILLSFLTL